MGSAGTCNMSDPNFNIDNLLDRLLGAGQLKSGDFVPIPEEEIINLCLKSRDAFLQEPMLLRLVAPLRICGDIHGQYSDLLRIFNNIGYPPEVSYLFLGDYVDRGSNSIETICLLFAFKVKYPANFFILRGNHECATISKVYGFFDECKRRYNIRLWKTFTDCFNCLPIAAMIEGKIFCCHGGLSPELESMDQIASITRPIDIPTKGLMCDLMWSDPDENIDGWGKSPRGMSLTFGADVVHNFVAKQKIDLICRAHEYVATGYKFFADKKLVTVFSAPNYCGGFNSGAVMTVKENLACSFAVFKPQKKPKKLVTNLDSSITPPNKKRKKDRT